MGSDVDEDDDETAEEEHVDEKNIYLCYTLLFQEIKIKLFIHLLNLIYQDTSFIQHLEF